MAREDTAAVSTGRACSLLPLHFPLCSPRALERKHSKSGRSAGHALIWPLRTGNLTWSHFSLKAQITADLNNLPGFGCRSHHTVGASPCLGRSSPSSSSTAVTFSCFQEAEGDSKSEMLQWPFSPSAANLIQNRSFTAQYTACLTVPTSPHFYSYKKVIRKVSTYSITPQQSIQHSCTMT